LQKQEAFEQASAVLGHCYLDRTALNAICAPRFLFALAEGWCRALQERPSCRRPVEQTSHKAAIAISAGSATADGFSTVKNAAFLIQTSNSSFLQISLATQPIAGVFFFWNDVKKTFRQGTPPLREPIASLRQRTWRLLRNAGL
jgi:hypothetical protein